MDTTRHIANEEGGSSTELTRPFASLPPFVSEVLSHLAHMLDAEVAVRTGAATVREFAASVLRCSHADVVEHRVDLSAVDHVRVGLALASDVETHGPLPAIGYDPDEAPAWDRIELGDETVSVVSGINAFFEAGTLAATPMVIGLVQNYAGHRLSAYSTRAGADEARARVAELLARARGCDDPFRNRTLEAKLDSHGAVTFRTVAVRAIDLADVFVPADVTRAIDRNVFGLFDALDVLVAAGLPARRGVLLTGPPGTGKTALCRAIANRLAGRATVVFCSAGVAAHALTRFYEEVASLAPAMAVIEDIDLLLGDRSGPSPALQTFLQALDGATLDAPGVVTLATTNDPSAIDVAARRAGRFDAIVDVPLPAHGARAGIVSRHLASLAPELDLERVAAATEGASGAQVRELCGRALLESTRTGEPITTDLVVDLWREAEPQTHPGQYL